MKELVFLLLSGTGFCFFLFALVLLLKPSGILFRRRILGFIFFILCWYVFIAHLVLSGLMIQLPFLFRVGVPLYYVVPPLIFIYVRCIYAGEHNFRKYDWLHFLPFVLAFIDLFPYFFFTSNAVKQAELIKCTDIPMALGTVGHGFLPAIWHYIFRGVHGLIYLFFTWRVIFKVHAVQKTEDREARIFTCMFTFLYIGNIINNKTILTQKSWLELYQLDSFYNYIIFLMLLSLMVMCIFFITNPSILYETIARLHLADKAEQEQRSANGIIANVGKTKIELKQELCPFFLADFLPRLEDLMKGTLIFKQKGITVNEVARQLDVTPHLLSAVLNNHYNQRFTDFINQYRITYLIELIESDTAYKQFTIEGLSMEAGFSSRAPFYAAFKKYTGTTPSEYLSKQIQ